MALKKKVLVVAEKLNTDGGKRIFDFVWHEHEKYEITVMTTWFYGDFFHIYSEDVTYLHSPVQAPGGAGRLKKIAKRIEVLLFRSVCPLRVRHGHYDALLALENGRLAQKLAAATNIPKKIAWIHRDYCHDADRWEIDPGAERASLSGYTNVVCSSEEAAQNIRRALGDPGNLVVAEDAVHVSDLMERAEESVVEIAPRAPEGVVRFVMVGSAQERKGYELLMEACHMLERDGERFEVLIIGRGDDEEGQSQRLRSVQKRLKLQSVRLLGCRRNVYKYMKRSDWLLSTAVSEGDLLPVYEAAALGIPAVLTDCTGVSTLLGDNEYGIVIRDISVLGIYETMKHILHHPELQPHYRQKIAERVEPACFARQMQRLEDLIES